MLCFLPQTYWSSGCDKLTQLETNHITVQCKSIPFNVPIDVDLHAFETAFVNAVVHVGVNLKMRGVEPVQDSSTVTGWRSNFNDLHPES